jgi:hypothetical protein
MLMLSLHVGCFGISIRDYRNFIEILIVVMLNIAIFIGFSEFFLLKPPENGQKCRF